MAIFSHKTWPEWIEEYAQSHQHPINRRCHFVGIPTIAVSIMVLPLSLFVFELVWIAAVLFVLGWVLQFIGHYYEKKPPEFFRDWRFLFVGLRWWFAKVHKVKKR